MVPSGAPVFELSTAFDWHTLRSMTESLASITWNETVNLAVARLEEKTGLSLAGLSQGEISVQVREWMKARSEGRLGITLYDSTR